MPRKPKASIQKTLENNHFVSFRKRNNVLSSNPHNRYIIKIFALYCFNLSLLNGGFSKHNMTWPPWPIFGIIVVTLNIKALAVT
jgi:hypothetical protein